MPFTPSPTPSRAAPPGHAPLSIASMRSRVAPQASTAGERACYIAPPWHPADPSAPASPPARPARCTSAAPAPRCSTTCSARHHGGEFLLRIEDTDRERSTDAATQVILDSLDWLGLTRDGRPCSSPRRMARHAEVARELLATGHAYHCYCTPEELAAMREQARRRGPAAALRRTLARPRSGRGAARRRAGDPPEGAARRRDGGRGPRAGHRARRQRRAGRHDHPAQRRHADLQPLGGGGRPRHGHHPRDPRRRPPDQHVPPGADLRRRWAGSCRDFAPSAADPRRRRGEAVEAARRAVRAGVPRAGLPARGAVQLPAAARLGPWRRGGARTARRRSGCSTSTGSAARASRGWTTPS